MHKCSCLRTHSHADHPSYAEQDARIAALTERAERAEKANALLRAECEAWREANGTHDWTGDADGPPYYITSVRIAMGMTDEAGALKGVG